MFRKMQIRPEEAPSCDYVVHENNIYIYYDGFGKFNASLNILIDTQAKSFCALTYNFHSNENHKKDYIIFSIIKTGNFIALNIVDHECKGVNINLGFSEERSKKISSEIVERSKNIETQVERGIILENQASLSAHSEKILMGFNSIAKEVLYSAEQGISAIKALSDICKLLDDENIKLNELMTTQEVKPTLQRRVS